MYCKIIKSAKELSDVMFFSYLLKISRNCLSYLTYLLCILISW